tara:strand:- start:1800 stop:2912 length:1113 start_codon:yes stop_codon:yes gene_type:complete
MAQTMKIKRSTGTGKPTSVAQGELFYAYGTGGTYGKRLAIGHVNGGGDTPEIIGGKFFTDLLDVTAGNITASKALLLDANSTVDEWKIRAQGQLKLFEATANGSNYLGIKAPATVNSDLTYTLPAEAVNGRFLQTDGSGVLSWTAVATTILIGADSGSNDTVNLGETINFTGTTNEIETTVSNNEITIGLPDNVVIAGNLTVNGTTTTINTATLDVEDSLIQLAKANTSSDSIDIGLYGIYDTGGTDKYSGLFRDASDSGKWKLFKDNQAAPAATVNPSGTGYAVATLVAHLEDSNITVTGGSITGITDLAVADGGTGLSAIAKGSILAANSANVLTAVDGGGSTDKMLLYTASSDTISWSNTIDGGTYS